MRSCKRAREIGAKERYKGGWGAKNKGVQIICRLHRLRASYRGGTDGEDTSRRKSRRKEGRTQNMRVICATDWRKDSTWGCPMR